MTDWQFNLLIALLVANWLAGYFQARSISELKKKLQVLENMLDVLMERTRR